MICFQVSVLWTTVTNRITVNDMKPQTLQTSNINNAWLPYCSWKVDGTVLTYWFIRTPWLTYLLAIGKTSILTLAPVTPGGWRHHLFGRCQWRSGLVGGKPGSGSWGDSWEEGRVGRESDLQFSWLNFGQPGWYQRKTNQEIKMSINHWLGKAGYGNMER